MKIGFFTDEYLPRTDGVVTSMINFKKGLEDLGHEVFIIAPSYPGYHDEPNGIIRTKSLNPILYDNVRLMIWGKKTIQRVSDLELDIIHSQTNFWASALAHRVALKTGTPHIASVHTIAPQLIDEYPNESRITTALGPLFVRHFYGRRPTKDYLLPPMNSKHPFMERLSWRMLGQYFDMFGRLIVPSSHFADKLQKLGVESQIEIIPNAIDLSVYRPNPAKKRGQAFSIVCVGRLSGEKRQKHLIDAVSKLKKKGLKIHLSLVGSGPEKGRYQRQVDELGLNKEVSFTGQLEPHNVKQLLAQADVGVLVSHGFDNQPMVILEYAAAGLPILYCDPDLSEGLTDENALLSGPDSKSIAKVLEELAASPKKRQKMSEASIELAQEFDIPKQSKKLIAVYKKLLAD